MRFLVRAAAVAAMMAVGGLIAPVASQAATPADQLIVGFSMSNLLTLDPSGNAGKETVQVMTNIYDGLVALDPVDRKKINPALAESWTVSDDHMSITFKMRPGALFASGNPVTAQDVVWTLHRLIGQNLNQAAPFKVRGFTPEAVEQSFVAPDDATVVVNLPRPMDPNVVIMMLGQVGPGSIIDSKLAMENEKDGDMGAAWLATNSAGSGAFKLQQIRSNELVVLDRNDNYWGTPSEMKRVVFRHLPESQTQRLQLERGDIDIAYSMAAPDLRALEGNADIKVETNGGGGFYYLAVSMKDERFAKRDVRLALRYLIDYVGINSAIMPFYGVSHQRPIHEGLLGALPDPGYTLDVAKAKQYLATAGYPDGFNVTIRTLPDAPFLNLATAIQSTLAEGGIKAEIITGSGDQTYGAMRERNFELVVGRSGGQLPHPDADLRALAYNPDNSDEANLTAVQAWRVSFFDEQINQMTDAALLISDPEAQNKAYQDILLRYEELVPAIQPISQVSDSTAVRADVEGLVIHPSWQTDLSVVRKVR